MPKKKQVSRFVAPNPGKRFMPPASFKVGKGIPAPDAGSPMFKKGGLKKLSPRKAKK